MALEREQLVSAYNKTEFDRSIGYLSFRDGVLPAVLETVGAAVTIPHLTPLVREASGEYSVWDDGDEIDAFLIDNQQVGVTLSTTDEIGVQVLRRGRVNAESVPLPAAQTQGLLETALRSLLLRQKGITVSEIDLV